MHFTTANRAKTWQTQRAKQQHGQNSGFIQGQQGGPSFSSS